MIDCIFKFILFDYYFPYFRINSTEILDFEEIIIKKIP